MPSDIIPACPVRTGGGTAGRSRADDIAMFGKEYRKQGVFGGTSFDSPAGKKGEDCAYEKTSFISCHCADLCDSSMEKSASERERSFGRGKAILVSSPVSPGAIQVSVASAPAITEEAVSRVVLEEVPINTPEQTPGKTKKTKQKRNKKNKKKSGEERQNKVEQSIVVPSKPHKPKSNLFDFW